MNVREVKIIIEFKLMSTESAEQKLFQFSRVGMLVKIELFLNNIQFTE